MTSSLRGRASPPPRHHFHLDNARPELICPEITRFAKNFCCAGWINPPRVAEADHYCFAQQFGDFTLFPQYEYPGYQRFFSRVQRGASSAADRHVFGRGRRHERRSREKAFRAGHFLRLHRNRKPRTKSLWRPGYSTSRLAKHSW